MKLSREEKSWILYDVGNSAFTLLITTIVPIYFNYLANNAQISATDYLAYWGYAASVATIIVALMGPIAGTMADMNGFKKIFFMISMFIGAAGCVLLGFARQWLVFLVIFVIAKIGFSASLTDRSIMYKNHDMQWVRASVVSERHLRMPERKRKYSYFCWLFSST